MKYEAIVIGVSSGGLNAMKTILPQLPADYGLPIIIVQHLRAESNGMWINALDKICGLNIREADEKEHIKNGNVYIAPPNYHLLIEPDRSFSLSTDKPVNFARPSIDVLFESAAHVYADKLIGIILTGSNSDGAKGLAKIKKAGGLALVEDPLSAETPFMPLAAIKATEVDQILKLEHIADKLKTIYRS